MKKIYLFFVLLMSIICSCQNNRIYNEIGIVTSIETSLEKGKYWVKVRYISARGEGFEFKTSCSDYRIGDTVRIR